MTSGAELAGNYLSRYERWMRSVGARRFGLLCSEQCSPMGIGRCSSPASASCDAFPDRGGGLLCKLATARTAVLMLGFN